MNGIKVSHDNININAPVPEMSLIETYINKQHHKDQKDIKISAGPSGKNLKVEHPPENH